LYSSNVREGGEDLGFIIVHSYFYVASHLSNVRESVELQENVNVEIVVLHILISFEGIVGLPIGYQFNKGGNRKLQGGLFIFIGKFSMSIFLQMKGGFATLHFIQMKFVLVIPYPPSHCLNERQYKVGCGILICSNKLVVSKWG
jgi:hypothetical protein